ncbi:uncharacterized protein LOC127734476 [Mytilus californianus]|uniref:uncharacterized protein LOC127734476 n=1 Tax=Mytilus californianus TaxID=6549 RepID=UPI002245021A|nr:uncharacterized protein LOC127734476 [Mytilus californianus]
MAQSAVDGNSEKFATHVNCEFCDTKKEVKWKCLDCGKIICNECKDKIHKKIRRGKYHEIVEIKEDKQVNFPETDFVNTKCQYHSEQLYSHFCKTCENLVCLRCIVRCHKGHELIEINEMYHTEINRLKKGQSILQNDITKAVTKMHEEKQKQISENSIYCNLKEEIDTQEKALINAVKEYANICRSKLDTSHKEISISIGENIDALSRNIKQFEGKYNELEDCLYTADIADFFHNVCGIDRQMYVGKEKTKSTFDVLANFIPGDISLSHFGKLESNENWFDYPTVDLNINKEYQTELCRVGYLFPCTDSLWIADNKYQILQKVKPEGDKLNILFQFNFPIYGIALTASNNLLLATGKSRLQQICCITGKLTDSIYEVQQFSPSAIHVTSEDKVIIGGKRKKTGRKALLVMNANGQEETVYELDQENRPLFTYPRKITDTRNGNIHVIDYKPSGFKGSVVTLGKEGNIINKYKGDPNISVMSGFKPVDIVTTPKDNVVLADVDTHTIHFLSNYGHLLTYFHTNDIGILYPYSLDFNLSGQHNIGCGRLPCSETKEAMIYKVTISGC